MKYPRCPDCDADMQLVPFFGKEVWRCPWTSQAHPGRVAPEGVPCDWPPGKPRLHQVFEGGAGR